MNDLDAIVKEFLLESHENLDRLDGDLVALEKDPGNRERLSSVFRTIHTIKGTCGFFGFSNLGALAHSGENLLSKLRDGDLAFGPLMASALLQLVDAIRRILRTIEATGQEGDANHGELIALLTGLLEAPADAAPSATPPDVQASSEMPPPEGDTSALSDTTIRVDVGLLDRLMNLVGELVLVRNQILEYTAGRPDPAFLNTSQHLNLLTTELQESVMKTRLQPIDNIWKKFPRAVRDMALACGKEVRLEMQGADTELDKTIIEAIKDPLTHLIRNAVDHGIEPPDVRRARGKAASGRLYLHAFHEGGQVNLEIGDDGGGIDPLRIKQKAIDLRLITGAQAAAMSERELLGLIFLPGFSTADKVTNVSGRGVGMDVVKNNIEHIGGAIDIQSQVGLGTTMKIKIPLTLAIIPALIVTSGGGRYAIPQVSLLELVRIEGDLLHRGLEHVHGTLVMRLRGNLLPLVYLGEQLRVARECPEDLANIVVLQADGRPFGLVVDTINDTEEIVVKPLGPLFQGNPLFAGATIRGDGKVALILDVLGIAQKAGVVSEARTPTAPSQAVAKKLQDRHSVLLFELDQANRSALPLSQVARLEQIPLGALEKTSGREVIQYRGQILPILRLGRSPLPGPDGCLQVVVYADRGRTAALVVDRIVDIVETPLELLELCPRRGILGPVIIQDRITDLLDVGATLAALEEEMGLASTTAGVS